jgi:hypothetical protein
MLIDLRSKDSLYIWSNLRENSSFACLDRFLCSNPWEKKILGCVSKSLPRFQSNHNAIILKTNASNHININPIMKYDKNWPQQEDLMSYYINGGTLIN